MLHARYIRYLFVHKRNVFFHALVLGVPVRGLIHDWSKVTPLEYFGIGRQFYPSSPGEKRRNAYTFRKATEHHRLRNNHEMDYWYLTEGRARRVPRRVLLETIADWAAFSGFSLRRARILTLARRTYAAWAKNYRMHPDTRVLLERYLSVRQGSSGA